MSYLLNIYLSVTTLLCLLPTATASPKNIFLRKADSSNSDQDDWYTSMVSQTASNWESSIEDQAITNSELPIAEQAFEDATARYENLRKQYIEKQCPAIYAPFPATLGAKPIDTEAHVDMTYTCAMMHDLAMSQLMLMEGDEETEVQANTEHFGIGTGTSQIHSNIASSSAAAKEITPLEAWKLSRRRKVEARCKDGSADGFPCKNIDLVAHIPLASLQAKFTGEAPQAANDLWGWTSEDERDFIVWGVSEGFYFLEVTNFAPKLLGFLPSTTGADDLNHDVKIANGIAYMGAEIENHGIQIFDMKRLLSINPEYDCQSEKYCQILYADGWYSGTANWPLGKSHNIVVDEESHFMYVVGQDSGCLGGLHVVDIYDPFNPIFISCIGVAGYVHDAQCVTYRGPDARYYGREICFCFHRKNVSIVDVTDKFDAKLLSKTKYIDPKWARQGWLSSEQSHIVFGDEFDEKNHENVEMTRTLVMNVVDLEEPGEAKAFSGTTTAMDSNQYVARLSSNARTIIMDSDGEDKGTDMIFQANSRAGLRILQVLNYETADFREIAYFDTFPKNDGSRFGGAWSVFPYFRSGLVVISSIEEGLFLVRPKYLTAVVDSDAPSGLDCRDKALRYKRNRHKDCAWVGDSDKTKLVRNRCKKEWKGAPIFLYCQETCGRVGLGPCQDLR